MLQFIKQGALALCTLMFSYVALAQIPKDPTEWRYEVKQINPSEYQILFTVKLNPKWHIWSSNPGGDGSLVPSSIRFDQKNNIKLIGTLQEKGNLISEEMEFIEGKVNYYADSVTFIQSIMGKKNMQVKGQYEYQVCNDMMCLPPITKDFSLILP